MLQQLQAWALLPVSAADGLEVTAAAPVDAAAQAAKFEANWAALKQQLYPVLGEDAAGAEAGPLGSPTAAPPADVGSAAYTAHLGNMSAELTAMLQQLQGSP